MLIKDRVFFCAPSRLLAGLGIRNELAPLLSKMGFRNGLIVTDTFFSEKTPLVSDLIKQMENYSIDSIVCDAGLPDPTTDLCNETTKEILQEHHNTEIDHIIALGGGSNMDLAKALCISLKFGGNIEQYVGKELPGKPLPLIAIPTTAGTGSEITPGSILKQKNSATKVALMSNDLRPIIAVIDPELTLSCPPSVTADAGLDALTHAIESYVTMDSVIYDREGNPDPGYSGRSDLTNIFAREAIQLCADNLSNAYHEGQNIEARTGMAYASVYAALSYGSAGLNAVHGLAYALAGLTHASHGSTNAVLLPYVIQELVSVRETELASIARMFGADGHGNTVLASQTAGILHKLVCELGIPGNLKGFGVTEQDLDGLVQDGLGVTRLSNAFPIQPAGQVYERIIHNAFNGVIY